MENNTQQGSQGWQQNADMQKTAQQPQQEGVEVQAPGRRRWWQWLLIYLIIGGVVYGLGYYVVNFNGDNQQNQQNQNTNTGANNQNSYVPNQNDLNAAVVTIQNSGFSPVSLTVKKGTTVKWVNGDSANHAVVADKEGFKGPELKKGDSYSVPFPIAGTFSYHCSLHPSMKGTITVTE